METLSPAQRFAAIAIGLVLTAMIAIWVLPWAGEQIVARLPPTKTPLPATPTPTITPTATQTPGPTPTPTLAITPPPRAVLLEPATYEVQAPDNCNLAPLGITLSHWGYTGTHETIEPLLCPGNIDAFVNPDELAAYASSRELTLFSGVNGDLETLRRFLANGFPVIVSRWMTTTTNITRARYQLVRGYDDTTRLLTIHEFAAGPDIDLPYRDMQQSWDALNRQYILVYPPEQQPNVDAILGVKWTQKSMWQDALDRAKDQLSDDDQNPFIWMNQGSALLALEKYEDAQAAFDQAQKLGLPTKLLRYRFDIYQCLLALEEYENLLTLTQSVIDDGANVEEIHLYRAQAYTALDDTANARLEYQRALEIHPQWSPAQKGLDSLPQ